MSRNDYTRSREGVIDMLRDALGIEPYAESTGPNNSTLLFYGVGKHSAIVQIFPYSGWDVYINDGQNNASVTLDWLRSHMVP